MDNTEKIEQERKYWRDLDSKYWSGEPGRALTEHQKQGWWVMEETYNQQLENARDDLISYRQIKFKYQQERKQLEMDQAKHRMDMGYGQDHPRELTHKGRVELKLTPETPKMQSKTRDRGGRN